MLVLCAAGSCGERPVLPVCLQRGVSPLCTNQAYHIYVCKPHLPLLPRLFMSSQNCLYSLFTLHPAQARSGSQPHCHDKVHGEVHCEHAYVYTRPAQSASASRNCKQNETIAVAPPTCQRDTHLPEQLLLQPAAASHLFAAANPSLAVINRTIASSTSITSQARVSASYRECVRYWRSCWPCFCAFFMMAYV